MAPRAGICILSRQQCNNVYESCYGHIDNRSLTVYRHYKQSTFPLSRDEQKRHFAGKPSKARSNTIYDLNKDILFPLDKNLFWRCPTVDFSSVWYENTGLIFFTDFRLKIFLWIFLDYSVWLFPSDFHGHNSLLIYDPKHLKGERMNWIRVGAVVRALASHQCVPVSIPGPDVICGLSLLLVLALAPRVFLRVLRFFSLLNNQHSKFQFDREFEGHGFISWRTVVCHPR